MTSLIDSYHEEVLADLLRLQIECAGDPLTYPFFSIRGKPPIWMVAFGQKTVVAMMYQRQIFDPTSLAKWNIPRSYDYVLVEREIIFSLKGEPVLIERLYFCKNGTALHAPIFSLVAVTTVSHHYHFDGQCHGELNIYTHFAGHSYPKGRICKTGKVPRHYLEETEPLAFR